MQRIIIIQIIFAVFIAPLVIHSQEPQSQEIQPLNAETQRLWNAHTVVPQTDDVKELRAFLQYGIDNWMQMNGRIHTSEGWQRFNIEKNKATFEAANRIIALSENIPGEEPPPPTTLAEFYGFEETDDLKFALRKKIMAFGMANVYSGWNPDRQQQYRDFIEELRKNPAHKHILKSAELSLLGYPLTAALFPNGIFGERPAFEESLRLYEEGFENYKRYFADSANYPYLKFQIGMLRHSHQQTAEMLEAVAISEQKDGFRRGTLVKPVLEFYRSLYEKHPDVPEAEGYLRMINNDLVKYEILGAGDQLVAWREAVEKLKQSLTESLEKKELDDNAFMRVSLFGNIAEEMESRTEAGKLLYQTVRPIFAASDNARVSNYAISFDIALSQLAREGLEFEFEAMLLDGTKIDIKDYRGKVVVLYYWATWCGPCIGELPGLKHTYEFFHDKGFELIAFSVDEDVEHLKQFVEKEELPWLNASKVLSKGANLADSREKYDIKAFPTTVLIGKDGKVIRGDARGWLLNQELRRLFAE